MRKRRTWSAAAAVLNQKAASQPWLLASCYRDEDLGPLLRGEPFREFRTRFPEPKKEEPER